MAALTNLNNIKAISKGDEKIQALNDTDPVVLAALSLVELEVPQAKFGTYTEMAQRYLAAHLIAMANESSEGKGNLSSETIGGISQSWTLPYLNTKSVLGSTQYGMQFIELRRRVIVPAIVVPPAC